MLDRASIDRLSRTPEKNAPELNVALAEEGTSDVLLALARCASLGASALETIAERVAKEGADVGRDPATPADEFVPVTTELDRLLIAHPRSTDRVRDEVLARHADEAFFILAAASHVHATARAIEHAIDVPAASAAHDRLWLALLPPHAVAPLVLEEWAQDPSALRREAAARVARDEKILEALARDPARRVRRAVASNWFAEKERAMLRERDTAPDVRARAQGALSPPVESAHGSIVESARFAAALRALEHGGVLAPDTVRALAGAGASLDDEGAMLAAMVLPREELAEVVATVVDSSAACASSLAAGIALRPAATSVDGAVDGDAELAEVIYDAVKALARTTTSESRLTGKARLAAWAAEGLARCAAVSRASLVGDLAKRPIAAERTILGRGAALVPSLVAELCDAASGSEVVPGALLELGWSDAKVPDATLVDLAARVAKPKKRAEDLPEDEVDLDPSARSLELLEKVVLATAVRANVSPRAALAVTALDARRVRYVLAAMPQWKGRLTGGRLARVLRQNAGAISAGNLESRARGSRVEHWTERLMTESEAAIALAVGHLTGAEVARRIAQGRLSVDDGLGLAWGAEARGALEGAPAVAPVVEWATKRRTESGGAFALWLLLEKLDRERGSTLVASSIDALGVRGTMPPSVVDALAVMEHRRPGRLETIHPQSPRGRAALASAIARAYRGVGGMRDERQGT